MIRQPKTCPLCGERVLHMALYQHLYDVHDNETLKTWAYGRQAGLEAAIQRVKGMKLRADSDFLQQVAAAIREIKEGTRG